MIRIIFFFILTATYTSHSQVTKKNVIGTITNVYNRPLANATIVATDSLDNIIAYDIADKQGKYRLEFSTVKTIISLKISFIGYLLIVRIISLCKIFKQHTVRAYA